MLKLLIIHWKGCMEGYWRGKLLLRLIRIFRMGFRGNIRRIRQGGMF